MAAKIEFKQSKAQFDQSIPEAALSAMGMMSARWGG